MYVHDQLMKARQDDLLRAAAVTVWPPRPGGHAARAATTPGYRPPSPALPGHIPPTSRPALQATLLQCSTGLLSGPGGLASCLRTGLLDVPFTGLSQPLDLGRTTRTVPPHLRAAVTARDRHCQFPSCTSPHPYAKPTTSSPGPQAAPPAWATWPCSADSTTSQ